MPLLDVGFGKKGSPTDKFYAGFSRFRVPTAGLNRSQWICLVLVQS